MRSHSDLFGATVKGHPWGGCSVHARGHDPISNTAAQQLYKPVVNIFYGGSVWPEQFEFGMLLAIVDDYDWGRGRRTRLSGHIALKDETQEIQKQSLQRLLPIVFPSEPSPRVYLECGESQFLEDPLTFLRTHYSNYEIACTSRKDRWERQSQDLRRQVQALFPPSLKHTRANALLRSQPSPPQWSRHEVRPQEPEHAPTGIPMPGDRPPSQRQSFFSQGPPQQPGHRQDGHEASFDHATSQQGRQDHSSHSWQTPQERQEPAAPDRAQVPPPPQQQQQQQQPSHPDNQQQQPSGSMYNRQEHARPAFIQQAGAQRRHQPQQNREHVSGPSNLTAAQQQSWRQSRLFFCRDLGVTSGAVPKTVKKAYYALSKQVHPDKNPAPGAAHRFIVLKQSFDAIVSIDAAYGVR